MVVEHQDIYTDLDELPIYNFTKCANGELKFMYHGRKGKITNHIKSKWEELYNNYCELTNTNKTLRYYRLIGEIEYLRKRDHIAPILINLLLKTPTNNRKNIINELKEWGLKIYEDKDIEQQVKRALKILNNSKNKLNRKLEELDDIKEKPTENISLSVQKAKLHKLLGIDVNVVTTSVLEWLAYWKEVEQLSNKK